MVNLANANLGNLIDGVSRNLIDTMILYKKPSCFGVHGEGLTPDPSFGVRLLEQHNFLNRKHFNLKGKT